MAVILHNCDSATSWATNHASSFTADTVDKMEGTASLKHVATGGNDPYCVYDYGSPYKDLSASPYLYLYYKSTTTNPSSVGYVSLWSDTTWTNGSWFQFNGYHTDWTHLTLDLSAPSSTTGAGVTLSNVRRIRIDFPESQTVTFWIDDIYADTPEPEEVDEAETIVLSEELGIYGLEQESVADTISLSENLDFATLGIVDEAENLNIEEEVTIGLQECLDLNTDFRFCKEQTETLENKINTCFEKLILLTNKLTTFLSFVQDVENKLGKTKKTVTQNLTNQVRYFRSWQRTTNSALINNPELPDVPQFVSKGKSYIYLYINEVLQSDIDIDSITINKSLNSAATMSFILGRPFDSTNPSLNSTVTVKYDEWFIYKGYITKVTPGDKQDSILVDCQDEMFTYQNQFIPVNIGHAPKERDLLVIYTETIYSAFQALGFNFEVGKFIPDSQSLTGKLQDVVTELVTMSGNNAWFIAVSQDSGLVLPTLVMLGDGGAIPLHVQEFNKNLQLYDVLSWNIESSAENLANIAYVYTGGRSGVKASDKYIYGQWGMPPTFVSLPMVCDAVPNWDESLAVPAAPNAKKEKATTGYGYDYQADNEKYKYANVFKSYRISTIDPAWTSRGYVYYDELDTEHSIPFIKVEFEQPYVKDSCEFSTSLRELGAYSQPIKPIVSKNASSMEWTAQTAEAAAIEEAKVLATATSGYLFDGFTLDIKAGYIQTPDIYQIIKDEKGNVTKFIRPNITVYYQAKRRLPEGVNLFTLPDNYEQLTDDYVYPYCFKTKKSGSLSQDYIVSMSLSGYSVKDGYTKKYYATDSSGNHIFDENGQYVITSEYIPGWNDIPYVVDIVNWKMSQTSDYKYKGTITLTLDALLYYRLNLSSVVSLSVPSYRQYNITQIAYNFSDFTVQLSLEHFEPYQRTVSLPYHGD